MKNKDEQPDVTEGKMLIHDQGIGSIGSRDIEERALELALIEGRKTISDEDRAQAEKELKRGAAPSGDDDTTMDSMSRDPSDPPVHRGRQVPDFDGGDEVKGLEQLVAEGVDEAEHDQMVAARRRRTT